VARYSSVHQEETTVLSLSTPDYQTYLNRHDPKELQAATDLYANVFNNHGTSLDGKIQLCRKTAWFAIHTTTGSIRVASNRCRLRWCPTCANARRRWIKEQALTWLKSASTAKFLTLTLKHTSAPLKDQIDCLYKCFRRLRLHPYIAKTIRGGLWFFEVKLSSRSQQWHPHIHCLIDSPFVPQSKISVLWHMITHGSTVVDIRTIPDPIRAAHYISKYCTKPAHLCDYSLEQMIEIYTALHGKRLCGTWGTLRGISLVEPPADDRKDWRNLGSWEQITSNQSTSPICAEIIAAWMRGVPRPDLLDKLPGKNDDKDIVRFFEPEVFNWENP
jgi:hypothetical protein